MHPTWQNIFKKILQTEEALYPIFVPANDPLAQSIAAAVLVTESTFAAIFGISPAAPAVPPATTNGQ